MKAFTELFTQLDATTSTNNKVAALEQYFSHAPHEDCAWAIYFISGNRIKRLVQRAALKRWLVDSCDLDEWMVDECYTAVGDLAETISLLIPPTHTADENSKLLDLSLSQWVKDHILPLRDLDEEQQGAIVKAWWQALPVDSCFIVTKLITGALRVGVSQLLVAKALAQLTGIDRASILHRLMGDWEPSGDFYAALIDPDTDRVSVSRPYPFFLASPLDKESESLGPIEDWAAEWKWDGIRAQLIRREQQTFIWTRGEELVTEKYPELVQAAEGLPDGTVIDGEIVAGKPGNILSFNELQRRIGRKRIPQKLLAEVPVHLIAYDLLECDGKDIRQQSLRDRRNGLCSLLGESDEDITISEQLSAKTWADLADHRAKARKTLAEGLMLKRWDSVYETGRKKGSWWKWKVDPLSIDAVLLYAQAGHGRRASLFTDYTFAVWQGESLLPVAKAYSGLDNKEINSLDKWIRSNTLERFGPVRSLKIKHVFEIGFEGIAKSTRHKSGIALRFPRILRWRHDMKAEDANTLDMVKDLLKVYDN